MTRPSLQEILAQGEIVLGIAPDKEEEFLDSVAVYSGLFEQFLPDIPAETKQNPALVERLAEVHSAILERAGQAHGAVSKELQALKRKGKGILAYTDLLPRSISTIRTRKG